MTKDYDIVFIGHMCYDIIIPYLGTEVVSPGSAVLCGAMAAAKTGCKIGAIVKMAREDEHINEPMIEAGVDVNIVESAVTTHSRVEHTSPDPDVRTLKLEKNAGFFTMDHLPDFNAKFVHLAGISNQEFTLDFIQALSRKEYRLSSDLQSYVRQVNPQTGEITLADFDSKQQILPLLDKVKLDAVEMELVTGTKDISKGAAMIAAYGPKEIIITQKEGVFCHSEGKEYYEKFSNKSIVGRTGRGDTTFASYLSWRISNPIEESLRFASALVSMKMESPGPFRGRLEDVLDRMNQHH